jgi:hypothetical protein
MPMEPRDIASGAATRLPLPVWLVTCASWIWFLFALLYFTDAACPFTAFLALAGSGFLLGVAWFVLTAVWPHLVRYPACFLWLTVPLVGLLACVLLLTGIGFVLRVALSEGALRECVANTAAAGGPKGGPSRVGLFQVEEVMVYREGVYFYTTWGFLDRHGVAYLPPGSELAPRIGVRHLYGRWYSFKWRF